MVVNVQRQIGPEAEKLKVIIEELRKRKLKLEKASVKGSMHPGQSVFVTQQGSQDYQPWGKKKKKKKKRHKFQNLGEKASTS